MEVTYVIDREYDSEYVFHMLRSNRKDPSGTASRAKRMGIDEEILAQLQGAEQFPDVQTVIDTLADERYEKHQELLRRRQQDYQTQWNDIATRFSSGQRLFKVGSPPSRRFVVISLSAQRCFPEALSFSTSVFPYLCAKYCQMWLISSS